MKKILFLIALVIGLGSPLLAQDLSKDYIVVDKSAINFAQLQSLYSGQANAFINESTKPAPYVVAAMLQGRQVVDLHLFAATKPGSLIFNSVTITTDNASGFSQFFKSWKSSVTGKVVVHSTDVFTTSEGEALKTKLVELTGLDFITL